MLQSIHLLFANAATNGIAFTPGTATAQANNTGGGEKEI